MIYVLEITSGNQTIDCTAMCESRVTKCYSSNRPSNELWGLLEFKKVHAAVTIIIIIIINNIIDKKLCDNRVRRFSLTTALRSKTISSVRQGLFVLKSIDPVAIKLKVVTIR